MSRNSRRKRLRIKLQARDPRDPKRALDGVKDAALGPKSFAPKTDSPVAETQDDLARPLADERLETRLHERAGQRLDQLETQAKAANVASGKPADAPSPAPPEQVIARRQRLWRWTCTLVANGYRVTVEAVAKAYFDSLKGGS